MALKVKWTKRASEKFDDINGYLEDQFGTSSAKSFTRKVFDLLDIMTHYPDLGQIEHEQYAIRGIRIVKQITLFYRVKGEEIILLQFFDNRQNPSTKLK
jgi:plasmid stabilization system protein ParE